MFGTKVTRFTAIFVLISALSFAIGNDLHAQSKHVKQRTKELEKKAEDREIDEDAAKAEAMERHLSIQSKETKKQMKRLKKQSKKYNKNKRDPFWKRWFIKKR